MQAFEALSAALLALISRLSCRECRRQLPAIRYVKMIGALRLQPRCSCSEQAAYRLQSRSELFPDQ